MLLDASRLTDKIASFTYLKSVLRPEDLMGNNLDALYDYLTSIGDTSISLINCTEAGEYGVKIIRVMDDAEKDNPYLHIFRVE